MLYLSINSYPGTKLNSHINQVVNQRFYSTSTPASGKLWCQQIFNEVNAVLSLLKSKFSGNFKYIPTKSREERLNLCDPKIERINTVIDKVHCGRPTKNVHVLTNSLVSFVREQDLKNANLFLSPNTKHRHLFLQIQTFKTGRTVQDNNFRRRIREFFGFDGVYPEVKSQVRKDLNNFYNNISKENTNVEQNQRALLAFVEGYILGKDSVSNNKSRWKYHVTFLLFTIFSMYFLLKSTNFSFNSVFDNVTTEIAEIDVKFNDVKGADEAKQELKNVVEFLKNPEKFSSLGGKLPKGVLLVGPPGTGKTLLAKAVAGEAGVPFFSKSGPEFDEIYVGVGARRIRELFKLAKENVPCVIFIDEIDSIGKERTSSSHHPHANDTINQLLTEMDGFRNNSGIIVMGATNRKEDLDRALLRPGRFDVEVTVPIPDFRGRKELLEHYLSKIRYQNVNVEKLARGTTNFTGADIENMVNQAALRAAVIGAQFVTTEHLEYARDKALMGPESVSRIMDEETNKITAYHEGGHTVVAYFTEHAQPLHKVTIIARGSSLGHTSYIPDKDVYHVSKTQLLAMLDTMMGGRAAEELIFGPDRITSGASSDLEKATELASKMVKRWGMSEDVGLSTYHSHSLISPQTANLIDSEVKKLLHESYERAKKILITHQDRHKELSEALLKYETLDSEEIHTIMKGKSIKRPKKEL